MGEEDYICYICDGSISEGEAVIGLEEGYLLFGSIVDQETHYYVHASCFFNIFSPRRMCKDQSRSRCIMDKKFKDFPKNMSWDDLVDYATQRIHLGLLREGGPGLRAEVYLWMNTAIIWSQKRK